MIKQLKFMFRNAKCTIGFVILAVYFLMAVLGPIVFPYTGQMESENRYAHASWEHPFGTDHLGRDVFTMLLSGSRNMMTIAFLTAVITVLIGVFFGILSGYLGGWVDKAIMFFTNIVLTIPSFPVLMILAALFTINDPFSFALVLSAWGWAGLCRAVRSQILSLRERDFIQICSVMGMSRMHVVFRELMPNISSYVLTNFILIMKNAISGSVGIMLLGLAAYDPTNWGTMIEQARMQGLMNLNAVRMLMYPLVAIVLFQAGAMLFSNGLDEVLNPRLRVD
ncbi:MAG: ABC transporter permease [Candidatus Fimimonas sp.]